MTRPLALDLLGFLIPLLAAGVIFISGYRAHRWPQWCQRSIITLPVFLVIIWACTLTGTFSLEIRPFFYHLGGGMVVLCCSALFLLAWAWGSSRTTFSPSFLSFLAVFAVFLIGLESSGPLWWRWMEKESWDRTVDINGCLRQSGGKTCGPTAAAMLLYHFGITSSEGEIAYLTGTSWFGTDGYALAQAIHLKAQSSGLVARMEKPDFNDMAVNKIPFVAQVRRPGIGNHAIFVECPGLEEIIIIDPLQGARIKMTRRDFEKEWDGTAICLVKK